MQSLTEIGKKYGTDKVAHNYTDTYDIAFRELREKPLNILEIGVWKGQSLRTFKEYFPNSKIYAIDIHNKKMYEEDRIFISQGDQSDINYLKTVFPDTIFDIILDDGSHFMNHQQISFEYLLPRVIKGGLYILEDLHTSTDDYPNHGGGDDKPNTTLKLLNDIKYKKSLENHCFYINDIHSLKNQIEKINLFYTNSTKSITSIIYKK